MQRRTQRYRQFVLLIVRHALADKSEKLLSAIVDVFDVKGEKLREVANAMGPGMCLLLRIVCAGMLNLSGRMHTQGPHSPHRENPCPG